MPMNRVLVVDDTPIQLKVVLPIIENEGINVTVASSGREALDLIESDPPDLILLDIVMPEMDGYEVCSRIKSSPAHSDIPVLFLTGRNEPKDIIKAFDVGGADYVTKPVNPPELVARIKTHLNLGNTIGELKEALEQVQMLSGLLRICSYCKSIQDEEQWVSLEDYLDTNSDARLTHCICPKCMKEQINSY